MDTPTQENFEGQFLALLPVLRRYARSLTRSDADGEDLFQDCAAKVIERRSQWRGLNLRAWALTIMTNLYRNSRRAAPRNLTVELDHAEAIPSADPLSDPLERQRLMDALNMLGEDARAVLMLVVIEGYSYEEVAAILNVPIGTVMSRLSRARRRLTEILKGENIITLRRPR